MRDDIELLEGEWMEGIQYVLKGLGFLARKGVRRYVLIPLLINVALFSGLIWWGSSEFSALVQWVDTFLPSWLQWLNWLLWILFFFAALILVSYAFVLIANLIAAPFNGFLSAKVQQMVTGESPETGLHFWTEVPRALKRQLQFMLYYLFCALILLVLLFIPVVNIIATPIWFLFNAWMMGMQYLDYPMDNNGIEFQSMRIRMADQRWLSLNFGGTVLLVTLIPILNFLVMPISVIAGTLLYVDRYRR